MLWKLYNHLYALVVKAHASLYSIEQVAKLLPDKKDSRDFGFSAEGEEVNYDPANDPVGIQWRFYQIPFNCCVFAAAALVASWQNGIRMSVRWLVKLARREGYITGNGFSFLRAPKKLVHKYGYLPYHYMPDETTGMSWDEYSKWTPEDDKLLAIAARFKPERYEQVRNMKEAKKAFRLGMAITTGCKWYSAMNNIRGLRPLAIGGYFIGGHSYADTSLRDFGGVDMVIMTNSFGRDWGKNGQAIDPSMFEAHDYAAYTESFLPVEALKRHVLEVFNGKAVKGTSSAIYVLENGEKRAFTKEEDYKQWCVEHQVNSFIPMRDRILDAIPEGNIM